MPVPISARAKKYLSNSDHYAELNAKDPNWMSSIKSVSNEDLIGVYSNEKDRIDRSIVITTKGIHYITNDSSDFIDYEEIKEVDSISHDKINMIQNPDARQLKLELYNGKVIEIPVIGMREGGGADIASFQSFLRGASQTKNIERGKSS